MRQPTCSVPGCEKTPRSASAEWCKMHYHRWYRHGDVHRCARGSDITVSAGRRYRTTYQPRHPLAWPSGKLYVHQVVLYAAIGPGAHACHWCGKPVRWEAAKGAADRLNVDHLNGRGDDNEPANLVASCQGCNTLRAHQARSDALRDAGFWSQHDTVARLAPRQPRVTAHAP